jgi:hypothetical protein
MVSSAVSIRLNWRGTEFNRRINATCYEFLRSTILAIDIVFAVRLTCKRMAFTTVDDGDILIS